MEPQQDDSSSSTTVITPDIQHSASNGQDATVQETPTILFSWARSLKIPLPQQSDQEDSQPGNLGKSTFERFTSGLGLRLSPNSPMKDESAESNSTALQSGGLGSFTKGIVDSSMNAIKAVQVKTRHIVSQNKRRYQEGEFDLDMTYIMKNIIAMGFPAGHISSGLFGYFEGFYRNHMEEVIKFFETHHQGKYKVYNLCSERLYDASLFEGKVACFPFDDHNCPPIQLITLFCQSAYSWLKEDTENIVVVHCKAGMARTGLMISSLLLYLKLFPTTEESINYYNQKRCVDGKGLVLPSQIRYVKYFECILKNFNGENPPARRCMLRGLRLHKCPYWIRPSITISNHNGVLFSTKKHPKTKNLMPEDFWFSSKKKGILLFGLPGEPGLTELAGDFKIHFHDRQGDFYCWLNTTMIENRISLSTTEFDDFDKRKLPSPGFQVDIVMIDYDGSLPQKPPSTDVSRAGGSLVTESASRESSKPSPKANEDLGSHDKDDIFSDSDAEDTGSSSSRHAQTGSDGRGPAIFGGSKSKASVKETTDIAKGIKQVSLKNEGVNQTPDARVRNEGNSDRSSSMLEAHSLDSTSASVIKAIAADASVFSFGDEDDYESE
ncbi:phosphatidylinositol 3,4,5-trisphosphate 3-phosphatase and protein-tyrosine-phosphatase PTEN2A [Elaeis guineensis]|uniref:Phosphatidylinositol 3,4,5-trisphosphate 3-phosphatase and protein-tyrosine-phosphatase PTEN2A n=1 Tax=Elaeis guineensis var. tenera TaxID=51953 RepID=A0A6I9QGK6_ELAGV|nr:phosphatidylinositol 3,4,5-trisphosphate 3-phosphatase and protein-tyrosine-phosphatase PTEN2A [Elaeis guineensis]XP_019702793.1 phosphatidylinositol 3,4,5-trisphosphate 3-phosphatase and protein-tyrosine-phosphatase PTEN2A [Elaeis guineensis]